MSDRELLELAAKAAGLHIDDWNCDMAVMYFWDGDPQNPERNHHYWSPLTDDGDALRLAVQCGIEISIVDDEPGNDGRSSRACAGYATESDPRARYVFEDHRGDLFAATRRAIVRAAAELGRRMQHE